MFDLRQQAARNAGFANFRDYIFPAKFRFDYTPADCERFHEAVERAVAPAVERVLEHRRRRLGLDVLRPWDLAVDPVSRHAASPVRDGRASSWARRIGSSSGSTPSLGGQFQTMIDERLLDLDSRKGKAPGGYCETLHFRGRPFIFMNAVGLVDDVMTLLHEAGHAFHAFASHRQPLIWQRHPGSEAAELASMSMELLAAPHLAQPTGYFSREDHRGAWLEHLEDVLLSLVAHRVGGRVPDLDLHQPRRRRRGGARRGLAPDPEPVRARGGLERARARAGRALVPPAPHLHVPVLLHRVRHRPARRAPDLAQQPHGSRAAAVARYREALALGAVRSLPEMYRAAGARLTFDAGLIGELVELVEDQIDTLRRAAAGVAVAAAVWLSPEPARQGCFSRRRKIPASPAPRRRAVSSWGEPGWPRKKESRWKGS